jgi:hypothetical protein
MNRRIAMGAKVRTVILLIIAMGLMFSCCGLDHALAAPAHAISNELRATIQVQPGQASITFDSSTMILEPGCRKAAGYEYGSTISDWLALHLTSVSIQGVTIPANQIQFITLSDGPGSEVEWQGYSISDINGAIITKQGQIADNLRVTSVASAKLTVWAIRYQDQVYNLSEEINLSVEINPYFTGNMQELNASSAEINVTDNNIALNGLQNGENFFSLPTGARVYCLFQPEDGLTPPEPLLSPFVYLAEDGEIIDQQACQISKRWPSGRYDIYVVNGSSIYKISLHIDHLYHDPDQAVSYLQAGHDILVANAVHLSWEEGQNQVPIHTITCGEVISLPIQVWATEDLPIRLTATWSGGIANHEVDLKQGNTEVVLPISFQQPGNFEVSIYAELR